MSIEEGDKTIAADGWLHDSKGDGHCDDYGCVKADGPLRVRVDSEQEARVVLDMAEQHGWVISTNFDHWKLSQINCVSLDRGYVNTYCTNRDTTCRHGVPFSGRKSQIRKYLSYHSEEETMSDDDLTHERGGRRCLVDHGKGCSCIECEFCGEFIRPSGFDDSCPEHPDRQREDDDDVDKSAGDDDGEGDVKRRLAKEILSGDTSLAGAATVNKLNLYERAIRDHCELSDGVCEWAYDQTHYKFDSSCGEGWQFKNGPEQVSDDWDFCPGCGDRIEITTDEGGEYEAGDLVEVVEFEGYDYIYEVSDDRYRTIGSDDKVWYPKKDFTKHADKIGSFAPDDDALERVNPDCNGSLFVTDDKVLFDPLCRTEDLEFSGSQLLYMDNGHGYQVQFAEATGIVLESFHQIAEVSDYE